MTKPRVLISDKMDPNAAKIFAERGCDVDVITDKTPDELAAMIGDYDGLAIRSSTKVTKQILDAATNLKVIGRAGIGVDNVDIPYASAKGVVVMNTPFGNSITTAEHAIALMFALARQLPEANRFVLECQVRPTTRPTPVNRSGQIAPIRLATQQNHQAPHRHLVPRPQQHVVVQNTGTQRRIMTRLEFEMQNPRFRFLNP